jgi:hypothetical protein
MFIKDYGYYDIEGSKRGPNRNKKSNERSIRKLRSLWDTFDYETQLRAAKVIRCLETQEAYR